MELDEYTDKDKTLLLAYEFIRLEEDEIARERVEAEAGRNSAIHRKRRR